MKNQLTDVCITHGNGDDGTQMAFFRLDTVRYYRYIRAWELLRAFCIDYEYGTPLISAVAIDIPLVL